MRDTSFPMSRALGYYPAMSVLSPHRCASLTTIVFVVLAGLFPLVAFDATAREAKKPGSAASRPSKQSKSTGKSRKAVPARTRAEAEGKPAPPREPGPFHGAWPDISRPQLGNGSPGSELLVAAHRTLGLRGSFDENTFIRHVFYVTALARRDSHRAESWARDLAGSLAKRRLLQKDRVPRRGDLVFFSMSKDHARSTGSPRILSAVVDSVKGNRLKFIAPLGERVSVGTATWRGKGHSGDTALLRCPAPPAGKSGTRGGKSRQATPCRAGDLYLGSVDAKVLGRLHPP